MGDITRVITLGIGPGSDIGGLVLSGLNVGEVVATVKGAATIADSSLYAVSLADALWGGVSVGVGGTVGWHAIGLEDGSGVWLFEDGSVMIWFDGETGLTIGDS